MIQQRIGDLLEIEEGGKYFYVVVLSLTSDRSGFNICADLLLPKREGRVTRLHRYEDISPFWRSKYAKATVEHRRAVKATEWFIYRIDDLGGQHVARIAVPTLEYREAMDSGCYSFDLVAGKVLARYTPDQNEHI